MSIPASSAHSISSAHRSDGMRSRKSQFFTLAVPIPRRSPTIRAVSFTPAPSERSMRISLAESLSVDRIMPMTSIPEWSGVNINR